MTLQNAQTAVWVYRERLHERWATPPLLDCLKFALTEVGEALDAELRQNLTYHRNTDRERDYVEEVADATMMFLTAWGQRQLPQLASEKLPQAKLSLLAMYTAVAINGVENEMPQHFVDQNIILCLRCANQLVEDLGEEVIKRLKRKEAKLLGLSLA
jgi:hypothetical protein